jgi:hypothetical protein
MPDFYSISESSYSDDARRWLDHEYRTRIEAQHREALRLQIQIGEQLRAANAAEECQGNYQRPATYRDALPSIDDVAGSVPTYVESNTSRERQEYVFNRLRSSHLSADTDRLRGRTILEGLDGLVSIMTYQPLRPSRPAPVHTYVKPKKIGKRDRLY